MRFRLLRSDLTGSAGSLRAGVEETDKEYDTHDPQEGTEGVEIRHERRAAKQGKQERITNRAAKCQKAEDGTRGSSLLIRGLPGCSLERIEAQESSCECEK